LSIAEKGNSFEIMRRTSRCEEQQHHHHHCHRLLFRSSVCVLDRQILFAVVSIIQAWNELQGQYRDKLQVLRQVKAKAETLARERRTKELTLSDLESLPKNSVVYKSAGKLFIQAPFDKVKKELSDEALKEKQSLTQLEVCHCV
jgi:chaperonin cofactor prefoldin